MDGRGKAGRRGTAEVDSSAPGTGGVASLSLLLLLMKIHGKPIEIMVTKRLIPFLLQGVNMALFEYIYSKNSAPRGVNFIGNFFC